MAILCTIAVKLQQPRCSLGAPRLMPMAWRPSLAPMEQVSWTMRFGRLDRDITFKVNAHKLIVVIPITAAMASDRSEITLQARTCPNSSVIFSRSPVLIYRDIFAIAPICQIYGRCHLNRIILIILLSSLASVNRPRSILSPAGAAYSSD